MRATAPKPNVATEPIQLDDISPVDLVVCPNCRTVISLHGVEDVQEVSEETGGILGNSRETDHGVFCPNCGQKLFDHRTWAKHLAVRLLEDEADGEDESEVVVELEEAGRK